MKPLTNQADADAAFSSDWAIVYKHSTRCPISAAAYNEVQKFAVANPDAPVYLIDVITSRAVSRYVAERTGIQHHSPQAILVEDGEVRWHASHFDITSAELERQAAQHES